jgi:hypothetical protein
MTRFTFRGEKVVVIGFGNAERNVYRFTEKYVCQLGTDGYPAERDIQRERLTT